MTMKNRFRWDKNRIFCLLAAVALCFAPLTSQAGVQMQTEQKVASASLGNTVVAIYARDLSTGNSLVQMNIDRPMIPASNMKLVTTAAALNVLGHDFRFRTKVDMVGDPAAGPVKLVVVGDGDPSFGDPRMLEQGNATVEDLVMTMVNHITRAGVTQVSEIVVDDRVFDRIYVHPTWPENQLEKWYCAQVAGINFHDNCLDFYPRPTYVGEAPQLVVSPVVPFLKIRNLGRTTKSGGDDNLALVRKIGTNNFTFRGSVRYPRTVPLSVTIHDPPIFFGQLIANRLQGAGVKVTAIRRPSMSEQLPEGRTLTVVESTLSAVVARCNKDSQNLFAEALLKRMGRQITGAPGSWANGAAAMRMFLHDKLGPTSAMVTIADGSGLSRDNRVTARLLVDLLEKMYQDDKTREHYVSSLSIGGVDGTLEKRLDDDVVGTVYGKSGYINRVSSLSGYLLIPTGEDDSPNSETHVIAFSMLFNDFPPSVGVRTKLKPLQNQIVKLLDGDAVRRLNLNYGG